MCIATVAHGGVNKSGRAHKGILTSRRGIPISLPGARAAYLGGAQRPATTSFWGGRDHLHSGGRPVSAPFSVQLDVLKVNTDGLLGWID